MTSSYIPTSQERIFELMKSGKNKVCDLTAKKALATRCLKLHSKITKDVKLADPSRSTDIIQNMKSIFDQWKNNNTIKNMKNEGHAAVLVQLMNIVDIIDDHLKDQPSCHRFVQATEFGFTDGHVVNNEVTIVFPAVPGVADTDRSPFVNINSTTVAGIQRAKGMGFADAQLAQVVVSPFVFELNDFFT